MPCGLVSSLLFQGCKLSPEPTSPLPKCLQLVSEPLGEGGERPATFMQVQARKSPKAPSWGDGLCLFSV